MTASFLCVAAEQDAEQSTTTPGLPYAGSVELDEVTKAPRSLATGQGSRRITWIVVQNRFTNANGSANAVNMLVGDIANQVIELQPGASTMPLPFRDLSEVFVRSL